MKRWPNYTEEELRAEFERETKLWENETKFLSNMSTIMTNLHYQRIIGLGPEAVPLILEALQDDNPDWWFWALASITGEDPTNPEHKDYVPFDEAREKWLEWGREKNLIPS